MRQIVAIGGGGFSEEGAASTIDDYILALTGNPSPRICFLPTASGDADKYIAKFHAAFVPPRAVPSHLLLHHPRELDDYPEQAVDTRDDLRTHLLSQDVIYVGGGNTPAMLAVWRLHGLDRLLREAWESGVILCGISAGALCWFESGTTDAFGRGIEPLHDGLGLLPGSHCPHYSGEPGRRPRYLQWVGDGTLPAGFAVDDGAALHFRDRTVAGLVVSRAGAAAYSVVRDGQAARERRIIPPDGSVL